MNSYLVYYREYCDTLYDTESQVVSLKVNMAYVYADDEYQAELWLLNYFGDNVVSIIKTEKV